MVNQEQIAIVKVVLDIDFFLVAALRTGCWAVDDVKLTLDATDGDRTAFARNLILLLYFYSQG